MTETDNAETGRAGRVDRIRKPEYRRRSHLTMTVHPDTVSRFAFLASHYRMSIGQITDKLVASLARCFDAEGKAQGLTCVHGEACRMARRDVPEVL